MSGETSLKFIIPRSLCEQDFTVSAVFDDRQPENVLRCDWLEKYHCNSASGYTYTIGNHTALLTVPRDLKETPEAFICELFGQPKTDPNRCLCVQAAIIIPVQSDSDSPGQAALIAGPITLSVLSLLVLVVVGILTYIRYRRRTSSKSKHDPNVRPDEFEHLRDPNSSPKLQRPTPISFLPANEETRLDVPQISATDSQKSSTQRVMCVSCGAVHLIKKPTPQTGEPSMDAPQFFATDSQEYLTPTVTAPPTETVPPKQETMLVRDKTHP